MEKTRAIESRSEEAGSTWMKKGGRESTEKSAGVTGVPVGNRHPQPSVSSFKQQTGHWLGRKEGGTVTTTTTTTVTVIAAPGSHCFLERSSACVRHRRELYVLFLV